MYEVLAALGIAVALVADAMAIAEGLPRLARRIRRRWKKHKRD